jgi:hypothetical protein
MAQNKNAIWLGDLLADIGRTVKLTDEEMMVFERDHSPARATSFESYCLPQTLCQRTFELFEKER